MEHVIAVQPEFKASVSEAKALYQEYKAEYGNDILIDQAVRLVDHWLDNQNKQSDQYLEREIIQDSMDMAFDIEIAALNASLQLKTKASRDKYEKINEILTHLRALLVCNS